MRDPALFVIGTPGGHCPAWLVSQLGIEPVRADAWSTVQTGAARQVLDASEAPAQALVIVERPALGLAAALAAGQVDDPAKWLQAWCEDARRLSWCAQTDPTRFLFVDAEDAWQHSDALAECLNERLGLNVARAGDATEFPAADPLSRALAEAISSAEPEAQALFVELQASCVLLADEATVAVYSPTASRVDGRAAARHLWELRSQARSAGEVAERMAEQLDTARVELQAQRAALEDVTDLLSRSRQAQGQHAAELESVLAQNQSLRRQLTDLQGHVAQQNQGHLALAQELELSRDSLAAAKRDLALAYQQNALQQQHDAEREQQLAQRDHDIRRLASQLQEAAATQQAGHAAAQTQAAALHGVQLDLATRQRELDQTLQENELLLQQLHQVQEELEQYYLECRRLKEAAVLAVQNNAFVKLGVAEVLPSRERDSPPHRELTFQLRGVVVDDQTIAEATVRLVEHHGHPGLVVFGNLQGPQLLSSWAETGREDGRPYMLLVPGDGPAKALLQAMGHVDWQLLQMLPAWLEHALQSTDIQLGRHWQQLARRLHGQLLAQGRKFRYRQVQRLSSIDGRATVLALRFNEVHWGSYHIPGITVHWQPDGPQAGIVLLNDADIGPPLTSWPDDEQGLPRDRLYLPLGLGLSQQDKRQTWARLPALDRDLILALLSIWPRALAQASEGAAPPGPAIALAAEALLPDALRALRRGARWLRPRRPPVELRHP